MFLQNRAASVLRESALAWKDGCRHLLAYDNIPGYQRLSWIGRKRIDHQAAIAILFSPAFWRAAFLVGVMTMAMHVLTWHLDLTGAMRDLFRALPLLLSMPWVASARRKKVFALLDFRDRAHRQTGRDA